RGGVVIRRGMWLLLVLAALAGAARAADYSVSTSPSPVIEGQPFRLTVSGPFPPAIGGFGAPIVHRNGQSIASALGSRSRLLCAGPAQQTLTVDAPALPAGSYVMTIYFGAELPTADASFPPTTQAALTVCRASYEGLWWKSPAGSESGWGVSIEHQGDILF